jgi:hypothetical protein
MNAEPDDSLFCKWGKSSEADVNQIIGQKLMIKVYIFVTNLCIF